MGRRSLRALSCSSPPPPALLLPRLSDRRESPGGGPRVTPPALPTPAAAAATASPGSGARKLRTESAVPPPVTDEDHDGSEGRPGRALIAKWPGDTPLPVPPLPPPPTNAACCAAHVPAGVGKAENGSGAPPKPSGGGSVGKPPRIKRAMAEVSTPRSPAPGSPELCVRRLLALRVWLPPIAASMGFRGGDVPLGHDPAVTSVVPTAGLAGVSSKGFGSIEPCQNCRVKLSPGKLKTAGRLRVARAPCEGRHVKSTPPLLLLRDTALHSHAGPR